MSVINLSLYVTLVISRLGRLAPLRLYVHFVRPTPLILRFLLRFRFWGISTSRSVHLPIYVECFE